MQLNKHLIYDSENSVDIVLSENINNKTDFIAYSKKDKRTRATEKCHLNIHRKSAFLYRPEKAETEELYHILPIGAPVVMMVLSLLFCALQAIVFTMLVSIYLDEVTE